MISLLLCFELAHQKGSTELIFNNNPFRGSIDIIVRFKYKMCHIGHMRVLFVCNQNKDRSRTAEDIFSGEHETRSAGLYNEKPLTKEMLDWSELVVVMDSDQRKEISRRFPREYLM